MAMLKHSNNVASLLTILSFTLLNGCVSFTKDHGFNEVNDLVEKRIGQTPVMLSAKETLCNQKQIENLLLNPLKADDAVRIALINNPNLQSQLLELKISEANLVQAGKPQNPKLSYARLTPIDDEFNIERAIVFEVISLLTIPLKTEIECRRFQQAKIQAAIDILEVAALTRKAYYEALAAKQTVANLEKIQDAADASAKLAYQMAQVGNLSKLQYAREQAFYAEIVSQVALAKQIEMQKREQLIRMLGLWGEQIHFHLPENLPNLPIEVKDSLELEKQALENRLDIQAMKNEIAGKAKALGLIQKTRFINVLELGYLHNTGQDIPRQRGYEIGIEIPIFDWGDAKIAASKAIYMQSLWHLRDIAIRARSEVREAYQTYRSNYDMAKHYRDAIIPLRKHILDENLLRYNGMLVSTFELLTDAREYMASTKAYVETLRDFWIAETYLQTAQMVKSPKN